MYLGYAYIFHKGFCAILFSDNEQNAVTLAHSAQRKHAFLVETKQKSKSQKQIPKKKVSLELLHQRLGYISTRSLISVVTENDCQDIEIRIYPDPFCKSCQISTINKNSISKLPLNPKTPFKWLFVDIIPSISYNFFNKIHYF